MDDTATAPLLTSHKAKPSPAKPPSIDGLIETYIGDTGALQLLKAIFVAFAWAFDAQQVFVSVFTDAAPPWHCVGNSSSCTASMTPATASPCALPPDTWAWDRPAETSVVSEWALQCAGHAALVSLPASSFFAGCLAGGFLLTTVADSRLGRKRTLVASLASMSVAGVLTAFLARNVWAYAALRFAAGLARSVVGTCTLVLSTELVGKTWRDVVSVAAFLCYTLGFLSLPVLAFALREASWRSMYLWISVPCLCYAFVLYFLAQESPRWLLVRGRTQEAVETLHKIASLNGMSTTDTTSLLSTTVDACNIVREEEGGGGMFATVRTMSERPWAIRRLAAIMAAGFGVGMVYFGMPLGVGNLGGSSIYLSTTYNAVAEVPSAVLSWLLIARANRRGSVVALAMAAGACSLACVAITNQGARMGAEVVSFFAACAAYDLILLYTVELFPTSVRNTAVGMVRQAMVLGGVAAPVLIALGRERSSVWSFGVFGIAIGCSGLFAACLPETRGKTMSDTMEEEEERSSVDQSGPIIGKYADSGDIV
ncbi:hypothetical protein HU200_018187 [Digitaria exilis]|uniref:H(+)/Pi cotransporter n=1 Tax=Digitaria exilis TaxID=1010633 RepID=A0A835F5I1_9POAL|nr:hypothetical protein HU200_018187 [Digitaria exilis]CAB3500598.1 unnamed protein product [Digitaria exilis]